MAKRDPSMGTIPTALHVGVDGVPWVRNPRVDARMRVLQVDADAQMSVTHGFLPAGLMVGTRARRSSASERHPAMNAISRGGTP